MGGVRRERRCVVGEPTAVQVRAAVQEAGDPADAVHLQRFFKTGPGEYGEGDVFAGVRVPVTRAIAKRFAALPLSEIDTLLDSPVHEERLAALLILNARFAKASKPRTLDVAAQEDMVQLYLAAVRRGRVNNWDLVDTSAEHILGPWLLDRPRDLLFELAASDDLWERRVAVLTTFAFLKAGDPSTTLALAEQLLPDRHDLIQKAVGWMLREVGKRVSRPTLTTFLDTHAPTMGRTALSYATEHLTPEERATYRTAR
ncbi:DNA alkylation repair protein [Nocardia puris]|uniref:DNA alkylation repair protein n=1 Tax=Nocardia puris TaxID=208602 RepID=UPI001894A47A|nr:DNA alkylation repair protein [Nocardia puris]MBF6211490.1 DNA alkylation repair protein [Nocardia puris]MBF6369549.1 DNA alkylation repair protein [Nocardia puris]MBF6458990.1 DNA alkylation repair protein [Nocardia puris]